MLPPVGENFMVVWQEREVETNDPPEMSAEASG